MAAAISQQLTPKRLDAFLDALATFGNVTLAARKIKASRESLYRKRREDPDFAARWEEASELGANALEDEARRRAFQGVKKPVYQGGELVGYVREYSDTLLIFLLKGAKPEKYRDNVQVTAHTINLGISAVLERMQDDSSIADAAAEYVAVIDAARPAEGEPGGAR